MAEWVCFFQALIFANQDADRDPESQRNICSVEFLRDILREMWVHTAVDENYISFALVGQLRLEIAVGYLPCLVDKHRCLLG